MRRVSINEFGKDHFSTLLYVESRNVDYTGQIDREKMRCNPDGEHGMLQGGRASFGRGWDDKYSTRLADGSQLSGHDDWDCVEDMINAGWMVWLGTGANPCIVLTDGGWEKAAELRKARGRKWGQPMLDAWRGTPR